MSHQHDCNPNIKKTLPGIITGLPAVQLLSTVVTPVKTNAQICSYMPAEVEDLNRIIWHTKSVPSRPISQFILTKGFKQDFKTNFEETNS